jgi:hypothetical protein
MLEPLHVSEALLPEVRRRRDLVILEGPFEFAFGDDGNLAGLVE